LYYLLDKYIGKNMKNFSTTNTLGLSHAEVQKYQSQGLTNAFTPKTSRTYTQIFIQNIFTPINNLVLSVGLLLIVFGYGSRALVYISIIFINILLGLVQEIRSKIALDTITHLSVPQVQVIRDGIQQSISSQDIVLHDFLKLQVGDVIPVDGVVVSGTAQLNESLLTGESNMISKKTDSEVLSGSAITSGSIVIQATRVGESSMANNLITQAKRFRTRVTPTQRDMNRIVQYIFIAVFVLSVIVVLQSIMYRQPFGELIGHIAVIVGIIPNSLFVLIGVSYSLGAIRMYRHNTLVQQLNSVESLSTLDILCFDKTGTLTTGEMLFHGLFPLGQESESEIWTYISTFTDSITVPNRTAEVIQIETKNHTTHRQLQSTRVEIPFSSEYKWSGITFENNDTFILGAPEILMKDTPEIVRHYQNKGLRVLVFGRSSESLVYSENPVIPSKIDFLALIVLQDELRSDIQQTLDFFHEAGVQTKIISGDGTATLQAIYSLIMGNHTERIVSGVDLELLSDTDFDTAVREVSIFGRITPQLKERIVDRLKAQGNRVAMVGDGVNDILSLKKADLGIAMNSGSQSTKQIADLVLLDNSLVSLTYGLLEGQKIQQALKHIFQIQLVRSLFVTFLIFLTLSFGIRIPFGIGQTTLLALLSTGIPSLFLTLWAQPKKLKKHALMNTFWKWIVPISAVFAVGGVAITVLILQRNELSASLFMYSLIFILILAAYIQRQRKMWLVCGGVFAATIWGLQLQYFLKIVKPMTFSLTDFTKVLAVIAVCFAILLVAKKIANTRKI
jgi:cation-transporting P-type ATPase E